MKMTDIITRRIRRMYVLFQCIAALVISLKVYIFAADISFGLFRSISSFPSYCHIMLEKHASLTSVALKFSTKAAIRSRSVPIGWDRGACFYQCPPHQ